MISVIIPVYNAERYLCGCLDSVLRSEYQDFELILVNDGSTDGSLSICEEYAARDSRVRLISQENRGASAARNRGIDACRGEWVVFVDSDDMISPNFLGLVVRDEYQGQDLLLFDFARSEADLAETVTTPETLWFGRARRQELFRSLLLRTQLMEGGNLNFVSPCGKAYRRELLEAASIRFSPELSFGEDKLFNAEYLTRVKHCAYSPVPVYSYNIHSDSSSHRFNPRLPYNLAKLLEGLRDTLETGALLAPLERDFYSYVLDNLSYSMVWTVFSPQNPQTYREKTEVCRTLRENPLYCEAMTYNRSCGHWVRKTLICFFRLRWYPAAGLLAKLWYHYLSWKNRQ